MDLSRRERQIMDILFARGEATVKEIQEHLPEAPTEMAIRRMLKILEDKGFLKRRKAGRAVVYMPRQSKKSAGVKALRHVLDTFFGGAVGDALAAHLSTKQPISPDELKQIQELIKQAKQKEKESSNE